MPRGGKREGAGRKPASPANQSSHTDSNTPADAGVPAPSTLPPASRARDIPDDIASRFPRYRLARVDSLVPYEKNARTHTPAQIDLLAKLITEYGWTNPVLVDGKRGVVAGHGRVLAAKKLGMDVVPTIELSHLSDAQKRAYVIADNASAINGAGWDNDLLSLELGELKDAGFDLTLSGFDLGEIDKIIGDLGGPESGAEALDDDALDGKVCCPSCGHEFKTVSKAFRLIASRK